MKRVLFLTFCFVLSANTVWAFPDTPVLDSFTGCTDNAAPPNSNWTNVSMSGGSPSNVDCEDQAAASATAATESDAYYDITSFNANVEAYATAATGFGANDWISVLIRLVNMGPGATDGYGVEIDNQGNTLKMFKLTDNVFAYLSAGVAKSPAAGDSFGIKAVGSTLCSWYKTAAGSWVEQECLTDTTFSAGGHIGILVKGAAGVGTLDDFGGGNVVSTRRPVAPILF